MGIGKVSKDNFTGISEQVGRSSDLSKVHKNFADQLHKVKTDLVHQELENLFNEIDKQGKVLGESQTIRDLKKYKDLIQRFLDYAVNKMYSLKEHTGWDRRGRHKIYTMIETVNKGLESLTEQLLSGQQDKIAILAKVDEIRGLLLDIYS